MINTQDTFPLGVTTDKLCKIEKKQEYSIERFDDETIKNILNKV